MIFYQTEDCDGEESCEEEHAATISREATLKMETADSPETLVSTYKTTWHHIPEDNSLNISCP
jgi:hypothetical protein